MSQDTGAPSINEAQLQRLEKESERFTNEIKQKEAENLQLRRDVETIKSQIAASRATFDEISKGQKTALDQKMKMKAIMASRKIQNGNEAKEKEIAELRSTLKRLRMKTFPRFNPSI